MCCWMGSHFHDWSDYNGVTFRVTRIGSHIFRFLVVRQFFIFTVSKRTRMFIKCSSFSLKKESINKNRKRLSWDCKNYIFAQK